MLLQGSCKDDERQTCYLQLLDVGGDKPLPFYGYEKNPIRIWDGAEQVSARSPEVFKMESGSGTSEH